MDKLIAQFSRPFQEVLERHRQWLCVSREIRIRVGQPVLLCGEKDVRTEAFRPDAQALEELLLSLCGGAMYACEEQLRAGFLTLKGGHRAGVCGRMLYRDGKPLRYAEIQSLNIRIARQIPCDRRAINCAGSRDALRSVLVISPPGMGKTTLLREMARSLSISGVQVSVADERGEIAASFGGIPQLDVGPCTDVMDAMPKAEAVHRMLRTMAPQVIVTDEIGSAQDAQALLEAQRSGVHILCSAHGNGMKDVLSRPSMQILMEGAVFDRLIVLGGAPGHIASIYDREGKPCSG